MGRSIAQKTSLTTMPNANRRGKPVLIKETPPINRVIAHSPIQAMGRRTRWRPILMACFFEGAEEELLPCVVKARRHEQLPESTAACVSELICGTLLRSTEIECVKPLLVEISADLAGDLSREFGYTPVEGLHFGSHYIHPAASRVPSDANLKNPSDLAGIWYFDNWVYNNDRANPGNLIFAQREDWRVVAIDHSDCFGGSGRLASDNLRSRALRWTDPVEVGTGFPDLLGPAIAANLRDTGRVMVRPARAAVEPALNAIPDEWWRVLTNGPADIASFLEQRWRPLYDWLKDWDDLGDMLSKGTIINV
ncbi:MAG: HipA family kinase [Armatimonadota bacterium]